MAESIDNGDIRMAKVIAPGVIVMILLIVGGLCYSSYLNTQVRIEMVKNGQGPRPLIIESREG